jgi:hypothetical protein
MMMFAKPKRHEENMCLKQFCVHRLVRRTCCFSRIATVQTPLDTVANETWAGGGVVDVTPHPTHDLVEIVSSGPAGSHPFFQSRKS